MSFRILLFIVALSFHFNTQAEHYLVTKTNDTIRFSGELETDHERYDQWSAFTVDNVNYTLQEIKCIKLDDDFYYNIQYRRIWKRVVSGKINVYALHEKDTARDERGRVTKTLYMQHESGDEMLPYRVKNLYRMIGSDDSLRKMLAHNIAIGRGGKSIMIGGIITTAASAFSLLVEGVLALLDADVDNAAVYVTASTTGLLSGAAGIVSGAAINKRSKYINLDPIYYYNSH